jgi:hypothetical protein
MAYEVLSEKILLLPGKCTPGLFDVVCYGKASCLHEEDLAKTRGQRNRSICQCAYASFF